MQTWLIAKLLIPGFHQWEAAPEKYAYLGNIHRHEFHITVEMRVDDNRTYEFIEIKDALHTWLLDMMGSDDGGMYITLKDMPKQSCEGFAEVIAKEFVAASYSCKQIRVTVLEDGENGARVEIGSE